LLPLGFLDDLLVKKVDLFNIEVMLKFEHNLHVVSFQLEQLLSLMVVDLKHLKSLLFDLLLKVDIVICGGHEGYSHLTR
jgi:hypothetical protein